MHIIPAFVVLLLIKIYYCQTHIVKPVIGVNHHCLAGISYGLVKFAYSCISYSPAIIGVAQVRVNFYCPVKIRYSFFGTFRQCYYIGIPAPTIYPCIIRLDFYDLGIIYNGLGMIAFSFLSQCSMKICVGISIRRGVFEYLC